MGGALGTVARFELGGAIHRRTTEMVFPLSTVVINMTGCLFAGLIAGLIEKLNYFSPSFKLFLLTGFLGGFTTFSAFGLDTMVLLQRHQFGWALTNLLISFIGSLFVLALGFRLIPYSH